MSDKTGHNCLEATPLGITGGKTDPDNRSDEAVKVATKKLEYKTKVTGKVIVLSAFPIASAVALFYFGMDAATKFSSNDPARIPFAGIPLLIAITLVSVVGLTLNHFLRREITVEDEYLVYRDPRTEIHLEIVKMAYSPPGEGFLRMLMFSDGETFVQLPAIFMDGKAFADLCDNIAKKRQKGRVDRDTYSL